MRVLKNKWRPVPGETFYFIYPTEIDTPHLLITDNRIHGDAIDINHPEYVLVIGEAECFDPDVDTLSNCFKTKNDARRALKSIMVVLKFSEGVVGDN